MERSVSAVAKRAFVIGVAVTGACCAISWAVETSGCLVVKAIVVHLHVWIDSMLFPAKQRSPDDIGRLDLLFQVLLRCTVYYYYFSSIAMPKKKGADVVDSGKSVEATSTPSSQATTPYPESTLTISRNKFAIPYTLCCAMRPLRLLTNLR